MKKVLIFVSAIILFAFLFTSCRPSNKCPAYGESYKYQKEQRY